MKSLVTGGAGFIGSHLVDRLLDAGDEVTVIDDLSTGALSNLEPGLERGATLVRGDIRDRELVADLMAAAPERIFHLAAQMDVRVSVANPIFDGDVNVLGTVNLLEAARDTGARFVFSSTGGAIYGEGEGRELPFTEESDLRPDSPYGQSKLSGEGYLALYRRLYGLDTLALRLGNVYGPRQNPHGEAGVIAMFCGRLVEGQSVTVFGDGAQTRDYIYVDDVVDAIIAASGSDRAGALNVGTGRETSVLDLVAALTPIFDFDGGPEFAPERVGEVQRCAISPARTESELGWRAGMEIDEGLATTADWVRERAAVESEAAP